MTITARAPAAHAYPEAGDHYSTPTGLIVRITRVHHAHHPRHREWADVRVTGPHGGAWSKRQPLVAGRLPYPAHRVPDADHTTELPIMGGMAPGAALDKLTAWTRGSVATTAELTAVVDALHRLVERNGDLERALAVRGLLDTELRATLVAVLADPEVNVDPVLSQRIDQAVIAWSGGSPPAGRHPSSGVTDGR